MRFGDPDHAGADKYLEYVRGSSGSTLEFEYTVLAADLDGNGLFMRANQLQLNGGTIQHPTTGRDANLNHAKPGQDGGFPNHKVDGSLQPIKLCGARVGSTAGVAREAEIDLCWDIGRAIPSGSDVVIEMRSKPFWYDGNPFRPWVEIGRGDDYTACAGSGTTCVQHTITGMHRGNARTHQMRIRRGNTQLETSQQLRASSPHSDAAPLNSAISGCYPMDSLMYCGKAQGRFWMDLEFTTPSNYSLVTEAGPGAGRF